MLNCWMPRSLADQGFSEIVGNLLTCFRMHSRSSRSRLPSASSSPLRCHFSSAIKSRSEEIQQFFAQEQDLFKIQCVNILLISNNKIYQQYQNPPQSCARHENRGRNSGL